MFVCQNACSLFSTTAGQAAARAPDAAQVTTLARCYNEVAEVAPRLDVVPLTPSSDWRPGKLSKLRPAAFQGSKLRPSRNMPLASRSSLQG